MPSDIYIKTGSSTWSKLVNAFVKTSSSVWSQAVGVWMFINADWVKVWPLSGIFSTRNPYIGTSSSTLYADRLTSSNVIRIGTSYVGNNAQWNANGWTITGYNYVWKYYDSSGTWIGSLRSGAGSGWTATTGQDTLPTSIWTATNSTNSDGYYLGFETTATASNSAYDGTSVSTKIKIVRKPPINLTGSLNTNSPEEGTAVTYSSSWNTTEEYKIDTNRTTSYWYTNSTNSTTGGTYVGSGYSYTPTSSDVGKYLYVVETAYNSGTDYDYGSTTGVEKKVIATNAITAASFQKTGSQRRITLPAAFASGTTLYVSTNGYITWGVDPAGSISPPNTGTTLSILNADLRQGASVSNGTNTSAGGLWAYSDATNYYVRWEGNYFTDAAQLAEYQVKFYFGQSYADVYIITNSITSSTPSNVSVVHNGNTFQTWSQSTAQSSTLLATSSMTQYTTKDGVDDDRTDLAPTPGAITNLQNYNFSTGTSNLFLTTGSNTSSVKYKFASTISDYVSSEFTASASSSTAQYYSNNLLSSLFTQKTFNSDTYNSSTTYYKNVYVYYAGNQYISLLQQFSGQAPTGTTSSNTYWTYSGPSSGSNTYSGGTIYSEGTLVRYNNNYYTARDPGFSGIPPTDQFNFVNSIYWTRTQQNSYAAGDYVLYLGTWYFAKPTTSFTGYYPTNTTYWQQQYMPLKVTATPYNGSTPGTAVSYSSSIFIRPDAASDPLTISSGPTFSGITTSSITATYLPSIYTNRVVVDVSGVTGYPYVKTVSGATQYTETPTGLTDTTTYNFYFTPRYLYSTGVYADGPLASGSQATLPLYTVTFSANGGTGSANPTSRKQTSSGGAITLAEQGTLSLSGKTFGGWNTASDGSGTNYTASSSYTPSSNITLYAKWNSSTYTVSYNSGSATSGTAPSSQTKTAGVNLTLSTNTGSLAKTGHTFSGWNTASDGTGTDYASGGTYSTDANLTLYPKFTADTYSVTYDKNTTDTVTNMPTSQTKTYGVNLTLSSNTPSRTGYTFDGWATSTTGAVAYAAGATYSSNAALSLYAKWTASAPGAATAPSVGTLTYNHPIMDLANTLTRNTNTNKTQNWTYSAVVSWPISWSSVANATTYELYTSTSSTVPASTTSGNITTSTGNVTTYTHTIAQNNRGTLTRYFFVRGKNANGDTGAWSPASASYSSSATSVSGISLRLYRGNGTSFSTPSTTPASTAMSYVWSGLVDRGNPNGTPAGEGHYCTMPNLTIAGVNDFATASATV